MKTALWRFHGRLLPRPVAVRSLIILLNMNCRAGGHGRCSTMEQARRRASTGDRFGQRQLLRLPRIGGERGWKGIATSPVSATPGPPAQVLIQSFSGLTTPTISTAVRITNEGATAYEYTYTWCVTNNETDQCGGSGSIFSSTDEKLIQPGQNFDTVLNSTVPSARKLLVPPRGTIRFVRFGSGTILYGRRAGNRRGWWWWWRFWRRRWREAAARAH